MNGVLGGALHLTSLFLRKEGQNAVVIVANAILLPACLVYLGFMLSPGDAAAQRTWVVGALVVALGGTCLSQVSLAVLVDRFHGPKRVLDTLPVSPTAYFIAYAAYGVMLSSVVTLAGGLFLALHGLTAPSLVQAPALVLFALLAGLALSASGMLLGRATPNAQTGDLVVSLAGLLMVFASPVLYSAKALPPLLRPLTWLSPYTHLATMASALARGEGLTPAPVLALMAFTAAAFIALRLQSSRRAQA